MKNFKFIVNRNGGCGAHTGKEANTPPCCSKRASRFVWVLVLMLTIGVGQMWGTDFTLSSASSVTEDGITVSFAKNNGSTAPTWYDAGLRLYAGNTVTISCEDNITDITFNWEKQGKKDFASATASTGTYTHPSSAGTGTWSGEATSVTFTIGSSGQLQLNTLSVTVDAGTPSYTITPQSNNTSYGTVELSGSVITASPKTGYRVSTSNPYSVSPANSATVNQNGNTFTVNPSASTTVTINFEEIPSHNINFHINGGSVESSSISVREGDTRGNFPSVTGLTTNCEYGTFVGWTQATSIASASTCPALVTSVTMNSSDVELYAVYSKTVGGTGASVGTTILSEDFEDFSLDDYPDAPGENATAYASGITYTCDPNSSSGTRVMNSGGPGEEANNIIVKQNGTFAIANIPTGGASTLTFSCAVGGSKTLTITSTSDDVSLGSNTGTTNARTYTLTVSNNATSFGLNFAATGGNMRLDDIAIVVATTTNAGATTYSLNANCCDPLGSINGSFF